jgi:hypothetical protein
MSLNFRLHGDYSKDGSWDDDTIVSYTGILPRGGAGLTSRACVSKGDEIVFSDGPDNSITLDVRKIRHWYQNLPARVAPNTDVFLEAFELDPAAVELLERCGWEITIDNKGQEEVATSGKTHSV